jgi:hypothetical protein
MLFVCARKAIIDIIQKECFLFTEYFAMALLSFCSITSRFMLITFDSWDEPLQRQVWFLCIVICCKLFPDTIKGDLAEDWHFAFFVSFRFVKKKENTEMM